MSEFSYENIVESLQRDANSLKNALQNASEFKDSNSPNIYLAAIKALRETLSLIREYDWNLQYSEYETQGHKEIAIWEQNGQGQIRNHKRFTISDEIRGVRVGDKVFDDNGYTGTVKHIWETGQIQVEQKPNVSCTYDSEKQLHSMPAGTNAKIAGSEPAHVSYGVI